MGTFRRNPSHAHPRRLLATGIGLLTAMPALAVATNPAPAGAAPPTVFAVTTTTDGGPGSLRDAVTQANLVADSSVEIDLPAGTYNLTICGPATEDANDSGDLDLTTSEAVTLTAVGGPATLRQTCPGERVLERTGQAPLAIDGVTITGGRLHPPEALGSAFGGGVWTGGDLTLTDVMVTDNRADATGGTESFDGRPAFGGGLYVGGSLTATRTTVSGNEAIAGAGQPGTGSSPATRGGPASGGGAFVGIGVSLVGGRWTGNVARGGVGGLAVPAQLAGAGGGSASGGGVHQNWDAPVALDGVTFADNAAIGGDAGGTSATSGPGTGEAGGDALGGAASLPGPAVVTGVEATGNLAHSGSAGSRPCDEIGCLTGAPTGEVRGGAFRLGATTTISGSTFDNNAATSGATSFYRFGMGFTPVGGNSRAAEGGAISTTDALVVSSSTLRSNKVIPGPTGRSDPPFRGGALATDGLATISGSTLSGNRAPGGSGGAASAASLHAAASTFTGNTAGTGGGAIAAGSIDLTGSEVAGNLVDGGRGAGLAASADVTLTDTTVHDNRLDAYVTPETGVVNGSAVSTAGLVTLTRTSVLDNDATAASAADGWLGVPSLTGGTITAGGLHADAATIARNHVAAMPGAVGAVISVATSLDARNTTIADNVVTVRSATLSSPQEASAVAAGVAMRLSWSTVTGNDGGVGGVPVPVPGATLAAPTLTVGASALGTPGVDPLCAATIAVTSGGYNQATDATCGLAGIGDVEGMGPLPLGQLAANGGPVPTRQPEPDSSLVDAVPPAACDVPVDARGVIRPAGTACDVGAVELTAADLVPRAPTGVHAGPRAGAAVVSWSPAAAPISHPVTSYLVTAQPSGETCTWTGGPLGCTVTGLPNGEPTTFTVTATNDLGTSPPSAPSEPVTPAAGVGFHPITPLRVWDSRTGPGPVGAVGAGDAGAVDVPVAGVGAIPADATAVVMNVTVTGGTKASYLVASPAGAPAPTAANLVFAPGQTVPNLVTVSLGAPSAGTAAGKVRFTNQQGNVDVIADVVGWYDNGTTPGDRYTPITPTRLLDSRTPTGGWTGPLGPGESRSLTVTGGPIPTDATAIVANITVTDGTAASYLSARPAGTANPGTANLLFAPGQTVPNLVTVGLGTPAMPAAAGKITLFNQHGTVDVIIDAVGYYQAGTGDLFHPTTPTRILDDRAGIGLTGPWGPAQARDLQVTGSGAPGTVPPDATAVVANLTATGGTTASFATLYPAGTSNPGTANLLWAPGQTVPNLTITGLSTDGKLTLFNQQGTIDLIADAAGWFAPW